MNMSSDNLYNVRKKSKIDHNLERRELPQSKYFAVPTPQRNHASNQNFTGDEHKYHSVANTLNTGGPNSLPPLNEFDRFVGHQDFERFVELAYKVKVMRHAIALKSINQNLDQNISAFSNDHSVGDDSRVENRFTKTTNFIRKHTMSEKLDDDGIDSKIMRGVFPRTDSLFDETINALTQEFENCKIHYSSLKNKTTAIEKPSKTEVDISDADQERSIHASRKKQKNMTDGNSSKEAIAIKYSKYQTDILTEWMVQHRSYPFPTSAQITALCDATNLNYSQVVNWTTNVRKRNLKATVEGGKKPHHFLDFLFLAEHRDKKELGKKKTVSNHFENTGAKRNTSSFLRMKKEMKDSENKKLKEEYKKNAELPYSSTIQSSGSIPNENMNRNMFYYHEKLQQPRGKETQSSLHAPHSNNCPPRLYYPSSYDNMFYQIPNPPFSGNSKYTGSQPPHYSPPSYHYGQMSNAYSMQESKRNESPIEIKKEDENIIYSSPSFQTYDDTPYVPPRKIMKKNVITPDHHKKKTFTEMPACETSRSFALHESEKMDNLKSDDHEFEPLDVNTILLKDEFDLKSDEMGAKFLQLCSNLNEEHHDMCNESQAIHDGTGKGKIYTPLLSDDYYSDELCLPDISISEKESDVAFSNPFDERDDHVFRSSTSARTLENGKVFRRDIPCEAGPCPKLKRPAVAKENYEAPLLDAVEELNIEDWMENDLDAPSEEDFLQEYLGPIVARTTV